MNTNHQELLYNLPANNVLKDKVILVTGAGVGRYCVPLLPHIGWHIF